MEKRVYFQKHKPLKFKFFQNENDFIVKENPINFSNRGNFLILKIRKKNLGTWDLIDILSKRLRVYSNEIGYAGLKDKNATTTQYISIPKKYSKDIKKFKHPKIQILDSYLHKEKLNIGDLIGNNFQIKLHDVSKKDALSIEKTLEEIIVFGVPNYFGFQRFGRDSKENLEKAKEIIYGDLHIKDRKLVKMLISSYQSNFFNNWLIGKVNSSKENKVSLLKGDILINKKTNKYITVKNLTKSITNSYENKELLLTGLLPGRKVFRTLFDARELEEKYDDLYVQEKGYRREAFIYPKINVSKYNEEEKEFFLDFNLPKGSYATVLIENLANRNLKV